MEIRAATPPSAEAWELTLLQSIGDALRALPALPEDGCIALGHGSPAGVGDGAGQMILTPADATSLQAAWVLALACHTAPELVRALVAGGVAHAGGYTEALRLPADVDAYIPLLARYVHQIAATLAPGVSEEARAQRIYSALNEALVALGDTDRFMLLAFVEQLRERLHVEPPHPGPSSP